MIYTQNYVNYNHPLCRAETCFGEGKPLLLVHLITVTAMTNLCLPGKIRHFYKTNITNTTQEETLIFIETQTIKYIMNIYIFCCVTFELRGVS